MQLLPHETFTLRSREPLSKIIEKLEAKIEPQKIIRWGFSRRHLPYEGTISHSGFQIHRIIHYRNSFLPLIRGKFESLPNETLVHITMRLHPFVMTFLIFVFSTLYSLSLAVFFSEILSGNVPVFEAVLFLGFPLFTLFSFWCVFWYEVNRSRRELTQIIQGA
ncbi:MAG: hypothetical protein WAN66_13065 [Limnoraphis robusta]